MSSNKVMDCSFNHLPVDVISLLISYLKFREWGVLDNAFSTHSEERDRWLQALRSSTIDVEIETNNKTLDNYIPLNWLIAKGIQVLSWELRHSNHEQQLIDIANGLPMLQSLEIFKCLNITALGINAISNGLKKLKSLYTNSFRNITDAEVTLLSNELLSLESLELVGYSSNISDIGVTSIATGLKKLKYLSLISCDGVTDQGVSSIVNGLPRLLFFGIGGPHITDEGVTTIARGLPLLYSLDLYRCSNITNASMNEIATRLTKLRSLDISSYSSSITDEGVTTIARGLPLLDSLNVNGCDISDASMNEIATGLTMLQSLDIGSCTKITDEGVIAIANSNLRHLTEFSICGFLKITDEGVIAIANGMTSLTSLDIGRVLQNSISDYALIEIANNMERLTTLKMSGCHHISADGVIAIANGLTMLESLDISDCPYINDKGVFAIANGLTMLKSLEISSSLLSNEGVIAIANGLTMLELLDISYNNEITYEGVIAIANGLKMLESLTISVSSCITEEGVTEVTNGAFTDIIVTYYECGMI